MGPFNSPTSGETIATLTRTHRAICSAYCRSSLLGEHYSDTCGEVFRRSIEGARTTISDDLFNRLSKLLEDGEFHELEKLFHAIDDSLTSETSADGDQQIDDHGDKGDSP